MEPSKDFPPFPQFRFSFFCFSFFIPSLLLSGPCKCRFGENPVAGHKTARRIINFSRFKTKIFLSVLCGKSNFAPVENDLIFGIMKNRLFLFAILCLSALCSWAQQPDFSMTGYAAMEGEGDFFHAGGTTGGEGGQVVTPQTFEELKQYVEDPSTPYIIRVTKEFTTGYPCKVDNEGQISESGVESTYGEVLRVGSNKTLLGVGSEAFFNRIGLVIQTQSNIIIRNIKFSMAGVPAIYVGYSLQYDRWHRLYTDTYAGMQAPDPDGGTASNPLPTSPFYDNWYFNATASRDSTFESKLSNRLFVQLQPWDRNAFSPVEKAILKSDLGLTPMNDGRLIRITVPPLTEERRARLAEAARHPDEADCAAAVEAWLSARAAAFEARS